jgi:hypothetical protein
MATNNKSSDRVPLVSEDGGRQDAAQKKPKEFAARW